MKHTYHYLASMSEINLEHGYVAFAWCGANSKGEEQVRMTRDPSLTNCEACKEASALHLLSKADARF